MKVFPDTEEGSNDGDYDPRWDRYRFQKGDTFSDGVSDEEPSKGQELWSLRFARLKGCFCCGSLTREAVLKRSVRNLPVPYKEDDNSRRSDAGDGSRAKIKQWLQSITAKLEASRTLVEASLLSQSQSQSNSQSLTAGVTRSRASLNTIYTQGDEELIRTASQSELPAYSYGQPQRLTDHHVISRLQMQLSSQAPPPSKQRKSKKRMHSIVLSPSLDEFEELLSDLGEGSNKAGSMGSQFSSPSTASPVPKNYEGRQDVVSNL